MSPEELKAYFQSALAEAKRPSDLFMFMMTLAALLTIFIIISIVSIPQIMWVIVGLLVIGLIIVRIDQVWTVNNAIKLDNSPYTYLDDIMREVCYNLEVNNVNLFTIRDTKYPIIVVGHFNKYSIIFDAEFMEVLDQNEARALIVREIAQIKYKTAELNSFIEPISEKLRVLFLGDIIKWMFGFWSRRAEETANRMALLYVRDPHLLIKALVKSKMGQRFTELFEEEGFLHQDTKPKSLFKRFAESFSYESYLTTQTQEILEYAHQQNIPLTTN